MMVGLNRPIEKNFLDSLGLPPTQDAIVANEGLGWDSRA